MPIHARYRWFYPIDWPQLSAVIRFRRAQGKCEGCGRPHGRMVCHLGDGRWWDSDKKQWRDGKGRPLRRRHAARPGRASATPLVHAVPASATSIRVGITRRARRQLSRDNSTVVGETQPYPGHHQQERNT